MNIKKAIDNLTETLNSYVGVVQSLNLSDKPKIRNKANHNIKEYGQRLYKK